MKTNKIFLLAIITSCIVALSSCEIAGLPLQTDYKYEYAKLDPHVGVTAYEYIKQRSTKDMTQFAYAIDKADYKAEYEKPGRTFLVLNDAGCNFYMGNAKITFQGMSKYDLQQWLNQLIIIGEYKSTDLTFTPQIVETLPSVYFNQGGTLPQKRRFLSLDPVLSQNLNTYRVLVDFVGKIYERDILKCGSLESNILPSNGGVIHIFARHPNYYPKDTAHPEIP